MSPEIMQIIFGAVSTLVLALSSVIWFILTRLIKKVDGLSQDMPVIIERLDKIEESISSVPNLRQDVAVLNQLVLKKRRNGSRLPLESEN